MTDHAIHCCKLAQLSIRQGFYQDGINYLRAALKQTSDRRAWSKIMLAIRELSRILPATS